MYKIFASKLLRPGWWAALAAMLSVAGGARADDTQYKNLERIRTVRVVVEFGGCAKDLLDMKEIRGRVLAELNDDLGLAALNGVDDYPEVHVFVEVAPWHKVKTCLVGISTSVREKVSIERLSKPGWKRKPHMAATWERKSVDVVPCCDLCSVVNCVLAEQGQKLVEDYRKARRELGDEE